MISKVYEEGDKCPRDITCTGVLIFPPVEDCYCHINPPCSNCVNNALTCDVCDWEDNK